MRATPGKPGHNGTPSPKKWSTTAVPAKLTPLAKGTAIESFPEPRVAAKRRLPVRLSSCGKIKAGQVMWRTKECKSGERPAVSGGKGLLNMTLYLLEGMAQ